MTATPFRAVLITLCLLLGPATALLAAQPNQPDDDPHVQAARDSLRAEPRRPERWLAVAHACWDLGTIEGRREADQVFEDSLQKWPGDSRILLEWARLNMERRFFGRARGLYRRALKSTPDSEPAQMGLVRLALYDYRRYLRVKSLREANTRLDQLLTSHPDHADALSSSVFARMMRADTSGAESRAAELVRRHPRDPRGHFFKLHFAMEAGRWDEASDDAAEALRCLEEPASIEAYRTLEHINWGWEDLREAMPDSARVILETNFWKHRDPTPATLLNERRLEHLRRVFLADLAYGLPERNLRGWDTEPGESIIRFGMPESRHITTGSQILTSFRAERMVHRHRIEGEPYEFHFEDQFLSGDWVEPYHWGRPSLMDKLASVLEGSMIHPVGGPNIDIVIDAVQFMGIGGDTRLELIVAVPMAPDSAAAWRRPLALYDRSWQLVAQRGGTFALAARVGDRERAGAEWLVDLLPFRVDPELDSLFVGSQVEVGRLAGFGGGFDRLLLRRFHEDSLEISDVMLLDRIDPDLASGPFARADGGTIPSPDATYQQGESVPIYFEAYGLTPAADGRHAYTLEVEINDLKTFGDWASKRRASLTANRRPRRPRSTSRFEEWSPTPSIERMLDLSVGRLPRGDYWVRVVIQDLTSGRKTHGEGAFRIVTSKLEKGWATP
ncbi:MAG: GWxTD domain-containing protein [Candidatus Eisenbacteria bacterium]|nr:GWxTD domain-containing protein [Candidatus Eisenbacteria bacterium]